MERERLFSHLRTLGRAFAQRGMRAEEQRLRLCHLAISHGLTEPGHTRDVRWTEEFVAEWLSLLAIPPYQHVYERRPRAAGCPRCVVEAPIDARASGIRGLVAFPGGTKQQCLACQHVWVALDEAREAKSAVMDGFMLPREAEGQPIRLTNP